MWTLSVSQQLQRLLRPKSLAIFEACLIGLVSALAAVSLKQALVGLDAWRMAIASLIPAWIALPGIGMGGGFLSGWLIQHFAPEATGSGIPQVKAALSYVDIALDLRVAVIKWVGSALALGSGLALGRQGPTVQIGAALAAQLSRWVETSPAYQRQLIAAGAAAGLAAGFNAPIAGVLFVAEELLQDVSDFTLGTAILASFVGGVVSRLLGGRGLIPDLRGISTSFTLPEIPILLVLGVLAGVLGGLFTRGILFSLAVNRNHLKHLTLPWRMALAGAITGGITSWLPISLRTTTGLQDFLSTAEGGWQIAALIFISQFGLILIAYGSGSPGGLFAPSLILGSALGGLLGISVDYLVQIPNFPFALETSSTTVYALTGMSAFFSAVTRSPITAIVIVFEMTTKFELVLPLMIGSVIAYLVSEKVISGSIYYHLLEQRGIRLAGNNAADKRWEGLTAADIMQSRVETLSSQMSINEARKAFSQSHHRGFPVMDRGQLVGILTTTDLAKASQFAIAGNLPLNQIMTRRLITIRPNDALTHVLHILNHYQIGRLPVMEGRKLVGIITRADIIRAELDQVNGDVRPLGAKPEASYVVYQTKAPALGQGRILVPLSNAQTADLLLQFAFAIARERNFEVECLQVILLPRHVPTAETAVEITASLKFLEHAVAQGNSAQISVHTQVRVAHDLAEAMLETIKERHIDLILMGWNGEHLAKGWVFGNAIDTVIRQAPCDLIMIKLAKKFRSLPQPSSYLTDNSAFDALRQLIEMKRWLVPTAGGPNAQAAIQLLPALVSMSHDPEIRILTVHHPSDSDPDTTGLEEEANFLRQFLPQSIVATAVCAPSIAEAVIDMAQKDQCDVIVLGASREGILQQVIQGNIPEAIVRQCQCTVILVRKAIS